MDVDGAAATSYQNVLNTQAVHLNQMIQLLLLMLVIWTTFIASALVLCCTSTFVNRTVDKETKKNA